MNDPFLRTSLPSIGQFVFATLFLLTASCSAVCTAQEILWADGFEEFEPGLLEPQSTIWQGWFANPSQAVVTDDPTFEGVRALQVYDGTFEGVDNEDTDVVAVWDTKETGHYQLSFRQYIPSEEFIGLPVGAYLNLQHHYTETAGNWATQLYFLPNNGENASFIRVDGINHAFDITPNTWVEILFDIDIDQDLASFYYDGEEVFTWQWSLASQNDDPHDSRFNGINLYSTCDPGDESNCTSLAWYDDFILEELAPAISPFGLVGPTEGQGINLQELQGEAVLFDWDDAITASGEDVHYSLILSNGIGNELASYPSDDEGSLSQFSWSQEQLANFLAANGIEMGESIVLYWDVMAFSGSDNIRAVNGPFQLTIGIQDPQPLLSAFFLQGPLEGQEITFIPSQGFELQFLFTESSTIDNSEINYEWILLNADNEVLSVIACNPGEFTLTKQLAEELIDELSLFTGESYELKWNVFAYSNDLVLPAVNGPYHWTWTIAMADGIANSQRELPQLFSSNGHLRVQSPSSFSYRLFDSGGRILANGSAQQFVEIDKLPVGLVVIQLEFEGEQLIYKVLVD